jgi:nucleotide-binding universal stress UspA family protein
VYVVMCLEADSQKAMPDVAVLEDKLESVKKHLTQEQVVCETILLTGGLSPGENILKFSTDIGADHIFLGIEKTSRTKKILLGSTAQFVILRASCPVTTTK